MTDPIDQPTQADPLTLAVQTDPAVQPTPVNPVNSVKQIQDGSNS